MRGTGHEIERTVEGVGVEWVRTIKRTYYLKAMVTTLRKALTTPTQGPRVLIAQSECMLSLQYTASETTEYKKAEAEFHRPHGAACCLL